MWSMALSQCGHLSWRLALLGALFLSLGCAGERAADVPKSGDARVISDLVEEFNEVRVDHKKATDLFAMGAAPGKAELRKKYGPLSFWPNVGGPVINGEEATLKVAVRNDETGDETGRLDWTFVKEGGAWKIKSAPLP